MKKILIDTNVYSLVFGNKKAKHPNYENVYKKIMENGKIKIVAGGTKYKKEISGTSNYNEIERNYRLKTQALKSANILLEYNDKKVDNEQITVIEKFCECNSEPIDEISRNKTLINKIKNRHHSIEEIKKILIDELKIRDFDDPHLIALLNVSGCKNIITNDDKAIPFLKQKCLYTDRIIPKIHKEQLLKKEGLKIK